MASFRSDGSLYNRNALDVTSDFETDENGDRPEMFIRGGMTDELRFKRDLDRGRVTDVEPVDHEVHEQGAP